MQSLHQLSAAAHGIDGPCLVLACQQADRHIGWLLPQLATSPALRRAATDALLLGAGQGAGDSQRSQLRKMLLRVHPDRTGDAGKMGTLLLLGLLERQGE